jgi:hypothetical protein
MKQNIPACFFGAVAQWLVRYPVTVEVASSSLVGAANLESTHKGKYD